MTRITRSIIICVAGAVTLSACSTTRPDVVPIGTVVAATSASDVLAIRPLAREEASFEENRSLTQEGALGRQAAIDGGYDVGRRLSDATFFTASGSFDITGT